MHVETTVVRGPEDRRLPAGILRPEERPSHRPRARYSLSIRDARDAEAAMRAGLALFAIPDSMVAMLGYPMRFPTILVVSHTLRPAVDTDLPVVEFVSEDAATQPRLEDLLVALLRFDLLAARAVLEGNLDLLDRAYLLKRLYQENLEEEATLVRLQDFVPLPRQGGPLPERALRRAAAGNRPRRMLP